MAEEGVPGDPAATGPVNRKAGWYRDRKTGQRRFWNGEAWTDLTDFITPYAVEPTGPQEPDSSPTGGARDFSRRAKIIGTSVTAVVLVAASLLIIRLVDPGTAPASTNDNASPLFSSDADSANGPLVTTTSPVESTTSSSSTSSTTAPGSVPTTSPDGTSPAVPPPPVTSEVPNPAGNVAVIGDSITELAGHDVERALHPYNVIVDAVGGTTMAEHLQKIESIESDGQPRDWVIELGTNDALPEHANPNWATDFANEVAALETQRCVVFVTVNPRIGTIATGIDGAIAGAVAAYANFHSLDWGDIEHRKAQWLDPDGLHPTTSGAAELAKLYRTAIRGCQGD